MCKGPAVGGTLALETICARHASLTTPTSWHTCSGRRVAAAPVMGLLSCRSKLHSNTGTESHMSSLRTHTVTLEADSIDMGCDCRWFLQESQPWWHQLAACCRRRCSTMQKVCQASTRQASSSLHWPTVGQIWWRLPACSRYLCLLKEVWRAAWSKLCLRVNTWVSAGGSLQICVAV